jgi:hypothetical protein
MPIFEIFYQPGKAFSSLEQRKAAWVLPFLLGLICLVGTTMTVIHFIGLETITRQALATTRLSPEQMQVAMNRASSPSQVYVTYAGALITGALSYVLIAGLLTVFALMGSKNPKFSSNFSMVCLAFFPLRLIIFVMTLLVLVVAQDPKSLEATNLLATNVGAFVDREKMGGGLYAILSQLDVLSFVEIGLLALGFSKVNRTSFFLGLVAVVSLWAIYVFLRAGLAAIF